MVFLQNSLIFKMKYTDNKVVFGKTQPDTRTGTCEILKINLWKSPEFFDIFTDTVGPVVLKFHVFDSVKVLCQVYTVDSANA